MEKKDWFSEFGDFIGFHFLANCFGIPLLSIVIIVGLIYLFCWLFNIKISDDNLSMILCITTLIITNIVSFIFYLMKISEKKKILKEFQKKILLIY